MALNTSPSLPSRKILVASDLGGRSDRAVDRAIQLALLWNAELVVVHAFDTASGMEYDQSPSWRQPPDLTARLEKNLREDVRDVPSASVRLIEGDAGTVIRDLASSEGFDLIVLGESRQQTFKGLGDTLNKLFRSAPASLLIVKQRPRHAYRKILVGTDFTDEALAGLEVATRMFPNASFTLMHAFEMPYRSLASDNQLSRDFGAMEQDTIRTFVARASLNEDVRRRISTLVEHGPPAQMLQQFAAEQAADLTVIGAHQRGHLFHALIGGQGPRILESVATDILVVRPVAS